VTVDFPTGGAIVSPADQLVIERFVRTAIAEHRRIIHVSGFASPEGSRAENSSLVRERAAAVANFVRQYLALRHILRIVVTVNGGGIKHLPSQLSDQVATLSY
jgi:outer membrane protein OmpA-like peptidoglycan-associated protein